LYVLGVEDTYFLISYINCHLLQERLSKIDITGGIEGLFRVVFQRLLEKKVGLLKHFRRYVKSLYQILPSCGVCGMEEGDIDGKGVVDREVLDEGGIDAGHGSVSFVYFAALLKSDNLGLTNSQPAQQH
jgi:hypothetical protein